MWEFTEIGMSRAVSHLERAISITGDNPLIQGALAYVYYQHANIGVEPVDYYRQRARESAGKAFAQDPEAALAHLTSGLLVAFENPVAGIRSFKRVLQTEPNNVEALLWLSCVSAMVWKSDEGRVYAERMRSVDPLHPMMDWVDGNLLRIDGDFEQAERKYRESLSTSRIILNVWFLGLTVAYLGRHEEACQLFDECYRDDPATITGRINRLYFHVLRQERDQAWQLLRSDLHVCDTVRRDFAYAFFLAECHALLGDTAGALEWLERSVNLGMINYPFLSQHDPFLASLRGEPRFHELMDKVKRSWETFEL